MQTTISRDVDAYSGKGHVQPQPCGQQNNDCRRHIHSPYGLTEGDDRRSSYVGLVISMRQCINSAAQLQGQIGVLPCPNQRIRSLMSVKHQYFRAGPNLGDIGQTRHAIGNPKITHFQGLRYSSPRTWIFVGAISPAMWASLGWLIWITVRSAGYWALLPHFWSDRIDIAARSFLQLTCPVGRDTPVLIGVMFEQTTGMGQTGKLGWRDERPANPFPRRSPPGVRAMPPGGGAWMPCIYPRKRRISSR